MYVEDWKKFIPTHYDENNVEIEVLMKERNSMHNTIELKMNGSNN